MFLKPNKKPAERKTISSITLWRNHIGRRPKKDLNKEWCMKYIEKKEKWQCDQKKKSKKKEMKVNERSKVSKRKNHLKSDSQ